MLHPTNISESLAETRWRCTSRAITRMAAAAANLMVEIIDRPARDTSLEPARKRWTYCPQLIPLSGTAA
jgi:hypothetical protein